MPTYSTLMSIQQYTGTLVPVGYRFTGGNYTPPAACQTNPNITWTEPNPYTTWTNWTGNTLPGMSSIVPRGYFGGIEFLRFCLATITYPDGDPWPFNFGSYRPSNSTYEGTDKWQWQATSLISGSGFRSMPNITGTYTFTGSTSAPTLNLSFSYSMQQLYLDSVLYDESWTSWEVEAAGVTYSGAVTFGTQTPNAPQTLRWYDGTTKTYSSYIVPCSFTSSFAATDQTIKVRLTNSAGEVTPWYTLKLIPAATSGATETDDAIFLVDGKAQNTLGSPVSSYRFQVTSPAAAAFDVTQAGSTLSHDFTAYAATLSANSTFSVQITKTSAQGCVRSTSASVTIKPLATDRLSSAMDAAHALLTASAETVSGSKVVKLYYSHRKPDGTRLVEARATISNATHPSLSLYKGDIYCMAKKTTGAADWGFWKSSDRGRTFNLMSYTSPWTSTEKYTDHIRGLGGFLYTVAIITSGSTHTLKFKWSENHGTTWKGPITLGTLTAAENVFINQDLTARGADLFAGIAKQTAGKVWTSQTRGLQWSVVP